MGAGVRRRDHAFYLAVALAGTVLIFAGFAPTFFMRPYLAPPEAPALTPLFIVHGVIFSGWFALLLTQILLVAVGRTDLHRRLGTAGVGLAAVMVVLGPMAAVRAAQRGMSLAFVATPLADVVVFAILVGLALWKRRKSETHKRLMLVATITIFPPAIARLPFAFAETALGVFGVTDLILLGCVIYDTAARRRLHPAFLWGGLLLVASHPLRVLLGETAAWQSFARWLIT